MRVEDLVRCRRFYDIMIRTNVTTFENKWVREIGILNEYDFVNYNRAMKDLKEVIFKDFQFKINNKILVTKSFLYRIGKEDNSQCSYCNQDTESIYHLFVECDKVKQFWLDLRQWLLSVSVRYNLQTKPCRPVDHGPVHSGPKGTFCRPSTLQTRLCADYIVNNFVSFLPMLFISYHYIFTNI